MCDRMTRVEVWIPADLSARGYSYMAVKPIDECIAPIVRALQKGGIDMRGSCCGHGKGNGDIQLQDGRLLVVIPDGDEYLATRKGELPEEGT